MEEKYWKRVLQAHLDKDRNKITCLVDGGKTFSVPCEIPDHIPDKPEKLIDTATELSKDKRLEELYVCIDDSDFVLPWEYVIMLLATNHSSFAYANISNDSLDIAFGLEIL